MNTFYRLLLLCITICLTPKAYAQTPNILLIIADDVGVDPVPNYAPAANKANMPHLEAMMQEGITFDKVWTNPICSPTRANILTGKYGFRTNVLNPTTLSQLSTTETSLHQYIDQVSNSSYSSSLIGKWHLSGEGNPDLDYPALFGIDYFAGLISGAVNNYNNWSLTINGQSNNNSEYITTKLTDLAIDWINDQNQPWFCWLAYNAPHSPFHLPPNNMHSQGNLSTDPDSIDANPLPYFLAMLESVDYEMGRLFENIPADELDNTLVIFIGDNGTPGGVIQAPYVANRSKGSLYQGGVHVPMVISGAGVNRMNDREGALINSTDLFATIVELTGSNLPQIHDSYSFADLLQNEGPGSRDCSYAEVINDGNQPSGWTTRDAVYKYIELENLPNRFYNLDEDPWEQSNLLNGTLNAAEQAAYDNLRNKCSINTNVDNLTGSGATEQLRIFPNPVYTELTVAWGGKPQQEYYISDISGRIVKRGTLLTAQNHISTRELNKGLFFLSVDGIFKKVIKM